MIYGIGVDVLKADRMNGLLERFGERTAARLLMPAELAQYRRNKRPARFLGLRFAAKEAIVKALGTGFAHGIWIRDVGIVQNAWGKPEVVYSPRGERLRRKLGVGEGHVTLTDEEGLIVAVAVLLRAAAPVEDSPAKKRPAAKSKSKSKSKAKMAPKGSSTPKPAAKRAAATSRRATTRRTWGER